MCSLKNPKYILRIVDSLPDTAICQTLKGPAYLPTVGVLFLLSMHREKRKCLSHLSLRPSFESSSHSSLLRMNETEEYPFSSKKFHIHYNKYGNSLIYVLLFHYSNRTLLMSAWPKSCQSKGYICFPDRTGHISMQRDHNWPTLQLCINITW